MSVSARSNHWHYRFKLKGQTYRGTTGLAATKQNLNAARDIEARVRLEAKGAKPIDTPLIGFQSASNEFLDWCEKAQYREHPNTALRIRTSFASLQGFFGNDAVQNIGPIDVERYKAHRAELGRKPITIRHDLDAFSLFCKYAVRAGWRKDNPMLGPDKVERPSAEGAVRMHVLTPDEEQAYFTLASSTLHDLAKLILLQGMRPEEAMSLRKSAFDRQRNTIKILGGKSRAAKRTLPLCAESAAILESRLPGESPWFFPSQRTRSGHLEKLNAQHDRICRDAGVSFVLYDLRHTFATRMLIDAKVDAASLAAILGHSTMSVLTKYVHPTEDHQREAMRRYESTRPKAQLILSRAHNPRAQSL